MGKSNWVRGPVGKKGYIIQANTLDMMWKGAATLAKNPTLAAAAGKTIATAAQSAAEQTPIVPVGSMALLYFIQGAFPTAFAWGTGFGAVMLGVGGVNWAMDKWGGETAWIDAYELAQEKAWEAYTSATGLSLGDVIEYFQVDDIIQEYAQNGGLTVSRPANPFEPALDYHWNQGVDIPPKSELSNPFEPKEYHPRQDGIVEHFEVFEPTYEEAEAINILYNKYAEQVSKVQDPFNPMEYHPDQTIRYAIYEPTPGEAAAIIEVLIDTHKPTQKIITENPPPDYIRPEILDDIKKNNFNKVLLAPIALFILIIFLKRRRKKR